jgi:hypothetical protein
MLEPNLTTTTLMAAAVLIAACAHATFAIYARLLRKQTTRALNAAFDAMAHMFFNTSRETETCAICMEPCNVLYRGSIVKCPHVFHPVCLRRWLSRTPTCPICRKSVCRLCKDAWKCLLCRMDSSLRHLIPSWVEEEAAEERNAL